MPKIERAEPPYVQIANHYRKRILEGDLKEGDQLPTMGDIASEWGVAPSTAARGIGQLAIEHLVQILARGTFVEPLQAGSDTPLDRIARVRESGRMTSGEEWELVQSAELARVPVYVTELLDLDPKTEVVRRESVIAAGRKPKASPVALTVQWYPPDFADLVPELLESRPIPGGAIAAIEKATGKTVAYGEDLFHGRSTDEHESSALGLPVGSPILAAAYIWRAEDGTVLEYGEFCLPERRTVRYEYNVASLKQ